LGQSYGADILAHTDEAKLDGSLRVQLRDEGLKIPQTFDLFPAIHTDDPHEDSGLQVVLGEAADKASLVDRRADFNTLYKKLKPCVQMRLEQELEAWRAFVALHETAHYVSFAIFVHNVNLNRDIFNTIQPYPSKPSQSFVANTIHAMTDWPVHDWHKFYLFAHSPNFPQNLAPMFLPVSGFSDYLTTEVTLKQVYERVADGGAGLYILSNYADPADSRRFLGDIMDFRRARYADYDHNTVSTLRAVLDYFTKHPVFGLTIVQATRLAADTIKKQPDLNDNLGSLAQVDSRPSVLVQPSQSIPATSFTYYAQKIQSDAAQALDARNRACGNSLGKDGLRLQ
jgi:hypothetical protein